MPTRYYTINDRPVKLEEPAPKKLHAVALDLKTGKWVDAPEMIARRFEPGADVEELDETTFEAKVPALQKHAAPTASKPEK
jgi:hypothetical protein